jgi:branched-chain amino acid transport system permease protein
MTFALLNGLIIGSIYALSAMGMTLVAGLLRMVQFAHGEFFVLASYLSAAGFRAGLSLPASIALAVGSVFAAGVLVEELLLKKFLQDATRSMMMTFLLSIVLSNAFLIAFGPYPVRSEPWVSGSFEVASGILIGAQRLVSGLIAILAFAVFYLWIRSSRTGRAIRAVAQDRVVAASFGISPARIQKMAFGLSAGLAGLAGAVLSPIFPVVPDSGAPVTLTAISVMVIGGMGSIRGAAVSGLLLGMAESFGSHFLSTRYSPAFGFLLLIVTLLWKPTGLYGNRI